MSWQGSLLAGYSVSSAWDGGGSAHAATYDADAHLQQWTATPVGATGSAQQRFGEGYTFSLENLKTVNTTNNLGFNVTATYNYNDATSAERVTSISVPNAPTMDTFVYDRRGRGLIAQRKLSATQTIAQDAYEYDSRNRLTSISHLGAKLEDLAYDGAGDLVSRTFPSGAAEIARYYVGEQLTLVNRNATTKLGYAHIQLGGKRIASFWVKTASGTNTNGVIYYHRDRRNDVVATTKNGGAMGVSYRYLPYGALDKVVNSAGTALTPGTEADDVVSELGFIGGLKLSGGLIHLKARAYSPTMRRFLQPDTLELRRYTYASGDALNRFDVSGRTSTVVESKPTVQDNGEATGRGAVTQQITIAWNGGPPAPAPDDPGDDDDDGGVPVNFGGGTGGGSGGGSGGSGSGYDRYKPRMPAWPPSHPFADKILSPRTAVYAVLAAGAVMSGAGVVVAAAALAGVVSGAVSGIMDHQNGADLASTIIDSTLISVTATMAPGGGILGNLASGLGFGSASEMVSEATGNGNMDVGKIAAAAAAGAAGGLLLGVAEAGYSHAGETTVAAVTNLLSAPVGATGAVAGSYLSRSLQ